MVFCPGSGTGGTGIGPHVSFSGISDSGGRPDPERIARYLETLPRQPDPVRTTTTVPQAQP